MARARKGTRPSRVRTTNGALLRLGAFREAYFDALYAMELEQIEQMLRRPKFRELLNRQTRELLQEMIEELGE